MLALINDLLYMEWLLAQSYQSIFSRFHRKFLWNYIVLYLDFYRVLTHISLILIWVYEWLPLAECWWTSGSTQITIIVLQCVKCVKLRNKINGQHMPENFLVEDRNVRKL